MGSLEGKRVLITRAAEDQAALAIRLRARGAEPIAFPCIEFAPPELAPPELALPELALPDAAPLDAAPGPGAEARFAAPEATFDRLALSPPDAIAIASPHAAERFIAILRARGIEPQNAFATVAICAAGEATARALAAQGIAALHPQDGVGALPLAQLIIDRLGSNSLRSNPFGSNQLGSNQLGSNSNRLDPNHPRRVLLAQPAEATPALAELLREAGFDVAILVLYRTVPLAQLTAVHRLGLMQLRAGEIDAISFASGSAARGFAKLLGPEAIPLAARARVGCMGASSAEVARSLGFTVAAVGARGFDSMLDALAACYSP